MDNTVLDMSHEAHWSHEGALTSYLADQLLLGRLSIFLGSGVSYNFNLPSWENLIGRLCRSRDVTFPPPGYPKEVSLMQIASSLRKNQFRNSSDDFLSTVHDELYRDANVTVQSLIEDKLFSAIGAVVTSSARGGVSSILTLNYDDCLERYLEVLGFVVDPIINPSHWASRADISVLHPHGFLPFDNTRERSDDIILDQSSFSDAIGNMSSLWFQRIVGVLRGSTTILIGLGTGDQNLLSMLKIANKDHPAKANGIKYNSLMLTVSPNRMAADSIMDHGVFTFELSDYEDHLPRFMLTICQKAARVRRSQLQIDRS